MAKSEDIEAKLAAYVDGQLDSADRAEIEKHLADHPQHRLLIEELMQHKHVLKNLPREHAPGDVAEAINAQLERAVLLGDIDDDSHVATMRIGHASQIRAIAAVLLLTASLAAVIYYLLPSPSRKPPQLADLRILPTTEPASAALPMEPDSPATQPMTELANVEPQTEQERRARSALDGGQTEKDAFATNVGNAAMFRNDVSDTAKGGNPAVGVGPIVIVIPSANPTATNQQVTDYLTSNKITWQTSAGSPPSPLQLDKSQEVMASKLQQVHVQQMQSAASAPTAQLGATPLENSPTPGGATGQFIVARQLPRQQAMELGDALTDLASRWQQQTKAAATLPAFPHFNQNTFSPAPASQPAVGQVFAMPTSAPSTPPRRIAAGDTLSIRVPQLVGPGIEPQSTQQVSSGGTVSLPMVDPISVAGMSESQAAEMISLKYRDAKLIPNATATVTIATTQPAVMTESAATSVQTAATSQPSAADLVDVVIVVKQSVSPSSQPTTSPTTQPVPQLQISPIKK